MTAGNRQMLDVRYATAPGSVETATMEDLRARFVVSGLFTPGQVSGAYTHHDRMVVAGAVPVGEQRLEPRRFDRADAARRGERFRAPARQRRAFGDAGRIARRFAAGAAEACQLPPHGAVPQRHDLVRHAGRGSDSAPMIERVRPAQFTTTVVSGRGASAPMRYTSSPPGTSTPPGRGLCS